MTPARAVYRKHHRLTKSLEYRAVYDAKMRAGAGPITLFVRPNGLDHPRLGLSIGRRAGPAVTRVALKRRLRDAFRFLAAEWSEDSPAFGPGLDIVISARAHEIRTPAAYRALIDQSLSRLRKPLEKRLERGEAGA